MSSVCCESNLKDNKVVRKCKITGRKTILVPYRTLHVPKYHSWMKDPKIRELTASEPLSLEEEYAMQRTWVLDENKCTFIVLHKGRFNETNDEVESMVGDVNLFLGESENPEDDISLIGELEVMIAEDEFRGQGLGYEACLAMLTYGIHFLHLKRFCVKIGFDNLVSQHLFKKFSFEEVSRSDVFREVTFELVVTKEVEQFIAENCYLSGICIEWSWDIDDDDYDDGGDDSSGGIGSEKRDA